MKLKSTLKKVLEIMKKNRVEKKNTKKAMNLVSSTVQSNNDNVGDNIEHDSPETSTKVQSDCKIANELRNLRDMGLKFFKQNKNILKQFRIHLNNLAIGAIYSSALLLSEFNSLTADCWIRIVSNWETK